MKEGEELIDPPLNVKVVFKLFGGLLSVLFEEAFSC